MYDVALPRIMAYILLDFPDSLGSSRDRLKSSKNDNFDCFWIVRFKTAPKSRNASILDKHGRTTSITSS